MNVLVFGISGMLGNAMFRLLSEHPSLTVYGTLRNPGTANQFPKTPRSHIHTGIDVDSYDSIIQAFKNSEPEAVINCVGLVKQLPNASDPLQALAVNSLFPHRLAAICKMVSARMIHIGTDCVFSGAKGSYVETDLPDARDLYGLSKLVGEVNYPHTLTLRTSIIGRELGGNRSLLDWFLSQEGNVRGFTKAIFSGLPTDELARIVLDLVLSKPDLSGLYHIAAQPIDKYSLLNLIRDRYEKSIEIIPDDRLVIDRSLSAEKFRKATGYCPPEWPELISGMYDFGLHQ